MLLYFKIFTKMSSQKLPKAAEEITRKPLPGNLYPLNTIKQNQTFSDMHLKIIFGEIIPELYLKMQFPEVTISIKEQPTSAKPIITEMVF